MKNQSHDSRTKKRLLLSLNGRVAVYKNASLR